MLQEKDEQIVEHEKSQDLSGFDCSNVSVEELQDLSGFECSSDSDKVLFTEGDVPAFGTHVSRSKALHVGIGGAIAEQASRHGGQQAATATQCGASSARGVSNFVSKDGSRSARTLKFQACRACALDGAVLALFICWGKFVIAT